VITHGCDRDIADRSLELDQRMGLVVLVGRAGFTAGTEVCIMADSAFVTIPLDIRLIAGTLVAKWPVTVDAVVASLATICTRHCCEIPERLVNWHKSVAGVDECGIWHASGAEIPVWAVEALVANTIDVLVTVSLGE
jgi:hypothetical protein